MTDLVAPGSTTPRVGLWDHPLVHPNLEDAAIRHTLGPLGSVPILGRAELAYRQRFRLKSWQYMTAVSDDLFLAFVVGTAGFASNGFVYATELASGRVHQKFAIVPLTVGTRVSPSSASGSHELVTRGLGVHIENLDEGRRFAARLDAQTEAGGNLAAELTFTSGEHDDHLALCVPLAGGRWNYTHKFAAFSVHGQVTIDGRRFAFEPGRAFGIMDYTKMYALRHSVWRWVALCGRSRQGATIGLNLVDPTPLAPVSENAMWIDGKREAVASVELSSESRDGESPWTVGGDSVDMTMQPVAHVGQKLDVPLVRHELHHVIGAFSGRVRTKSGHVHDLERVIGIAEDYDTWW